MAGGTELGRVRGLGSAKHGSEHWLRQRTTAIGNLLLMIWLFVSLVRLPGYDHEIISAWIGQPIVAVPLILLVLSVFLHIRLGLQVLIEDYVKDDALKAMSLVALNFFCIGLGAVALFAIVEIALTGTPK